MAVDSQWSSPQVTELANQIGDFLQYWGFKRVHGRIWTILFLSKKSLDAADLRQRLKISKALVSLSIRDLLKYGVVLEDGKSSRGTVLYRAADDVRPAIMKVLQEREREMISRIERAHKDCETMDPLNLDRLEIDTQRLRSLSQMIELASALVRNVLIVERTSPEILAGFVKLLSSDMTPSETSTKE